MNNPDFLTAQANIEKTCVVADSSHQYKSVVWACLCIVAVGLIGYWPSFHTPFHFDDIPHIPENSSLHSLNAKEIWVYNPRSRFVLCISLALNYAFGQTEVFGYHLTNFLIHIGNGLLLFWFLILLRSTPVLQSAYAGKDPGLTWVIAWATALIFVAHPIQTQAVTYIIQRAASLATLFYLSAMMLYLQGRLSLLASSPGKSIGFFAGFLLASLLALFTKEISFTLPFAIFLLEIFFFQTSFRSRKSKILSLLLPLMLAFTFLSIFVKSQGMALRLDHLWDLTAVTKEISRWHYLCTQFRVIGTYLRLFVLPISQNLDYDYPLADGLWDMWTLSSFVGLMLLLLAACKLYRHQRLVSFGIFFFFLALAIESFSITIQDVIFEHRMYLPMIGLTIATCAGLASLFARWHSLPQYARLPLPFAKIGGVSLVVIFLLMTVATYRRNQIWQNGISLWQDVVQKSPFKARGYNNLGVAYEEAGLYPQSLAAYRKSLALNPNLPETYNGLGNVYQKLEKYHEAMEAYLQTLQRQPGHFKAHLNLGVVYRKLGRYEESLQAYQKAIGLKPGFALSYYNLGCLYEQLGQYDKAITEYKLAITYNPKLAEVYNNLANIHYHRQEYAQALAVYQEAIRYKPDLVVAHYNLGVIYYLLGQPAAAQQAWQRTLVLDPHHQKALDGLQSLNTVK